MRMVKYKRGPLSTNLNDDGNDHDGGGGDIDIDAIYTGMSGQIMAMDMDMNSIAMHTPNEKN